jgi:hypothetical protein
MKKIKKIFLALILLFALSSVSLAFQGYVAADYDVKEQNFTTTLHLQKRVLLGLYVGVTAKTLPGLIPDGINYDLWAGLLLGDWSLKFSVIDTYSFGDPFQPNHRYVIRLRYDF